MHAAASARLWARGCDISTAFIESGGGDREPLSIGHAARPPLSFCFDALRRLQNTDGGWPYRSGSSRTEPTAYALLALEASADTTASRRLGMDWLKYTQRQDGGWPPQPGIQKSTWVTALPLLIPSFNAEASACRKAIQFLLESSGRETSFLVRLRYFLMGVSGEDRRSGAGWPWYPDTAGWVTPSALSILALSRFAKSNSEIEARIRAGREFLLNRRCSDGGWNHGSSRALGHEAASYPETTGVALLALHGFAVRDVSKALDLASRQLAISRSVEGCCWLEMALRSHGRSDQMRNVLRPRSSIEYALLILTALGDTGRNAFIS